MIERGRLIEFKEDYERERGGLRDVHLTKEQTEDGKRAEEDDEDVRYQREEARVTIRAVVIDERSTYQKDQRPTNFCAPAIHHIWNPFLFLLRFLEEK